MATERLSETSGSRYACGASQTGKAGTPDVNIERGEGGVNEGLVRVVGVGDGKLTIMPHDSHAQSSVARQTAPS